MKPFALLMLTNLRVVQIGTLDELRDAIATLRATNSPCLALKWNALASCYAQMEQR